MKYSLKIKPYGESQDGDLITKFEDEEWDLVIDLQKRLIRNFKEVYADVNFENLTVFEDTLEINFNKNKNIKDAELEDYICILCGYNMENVIFFDDKEYYIRGEIILEEKKKISSLEKINLIAKEYYN